MAQQPARKRAREATEPVSREGSARHRHFVDHTSDLFRALFHDEHRQKEARLAGMLYTSAAGESYQQYERLVWNLMKTHHRFQLGPDALKKQIPKLQELDVTSFNELWKQYKRHCDYENLATMQSNALIDTLESRSKKLEDVAHQAKATHQELQRAREEAQGCRTQLEVREKELMNQLVEQADASKLIEAERDSAQSALSELRAELTAAQAQLALNSEASARAEHELSDQCSRHAAALAEVKQQAQERVDQLEAEKKTLETAVVHEKDKMNVKASNSNRIYEENIVLEKQLQGRIERSEQLAEENMLLKAQLRAAMSHQMAADNASTLLACNSKRPLQNRNSPTKAEQESVKSRDLQPKFCTDSAKVSAFQKLMSLIKD